MLRKLLALIAAALLLQPGYVEARGHGGSHTSTRSTSSHSTSTRSTSRVTRSSGTHSSSHRTPHSTRTRHSTKTRRDPAQRRAFMREHPCPSTGRSSGACPGYVVDHVKALKHGGPDRPSNMQWQTVAEAKAKDRWE